MYQSFSMSKQYSNINGQIKEVNKVVEENNNIKKYYGTIKNKNKDDLLHKFYKGNYNYSNKSNKFLEAKSKNKENWLLKTHNNTKEKIYKRPYKKYSKYMDINFLGKKSKNKSRKLKNKSRKLKNKSHKLKKKSQKFKKKSHKTKQQNIMKEYNNIVRQLNKLKSRKSRK